MAGKDKLKNMLPDEEPKPVIKRAPGFRFSTDAPAPEQAEAQTAAITDAQKSGKEESQKSSNAEEPPPVVRVKLGNAIRKDLLTGMKRIAVDEGRYDYEVIEEALQEYIERRQQKSESA